MGRESPNVLHCARRIHQRVWTRPLVPATFAAVSFGREVRRRRRNLGLTLEQLAEASGLSPHFLSTVETEKRDPSLSTIEAIAKGLECQAGELLGSVKGVSPAALEIAKQYDAVSAEIQEGVSIILRASARRRR